MIVSATSIQTVARRLLNMIIAEVLTIYSVILQLNIVMVKKSPLLHKKIVQYFFLIFGRNTFKQIEFQIGPEKTNS